MATPTTLHQRYSLGMRRDHGREDLPEDALWNLVDFIPDVLDARLRKRGGWVNASQDINGIQGTAAWIAAGIVADYTAGQSKLAFDEDGRAYEAESALSTENIGLAHPTLSPVFYDDMVIVPHATSSDPPKKITRSGGVHTIANLGGTPPAGRHAIVYKDVLWLALDKRIHFSVAGNPESWDTNVRYLDVSYPITGFAAPGGNGVMVFSEGRTVRVRGTVPPPDSDMVVDDPIFTIGCTDSRSIAHWQNKAIFANADGLFMTDGSSVPDNLTRLCGMQSWWRDVMAGRAGFTPAGSGYDRTSWSIAGGIFGDYYYYSIMQGTTLVDSGMIDLQNQVWIRLANIDAAFFFGREYPSDLFFGRRNAARVASVADVFAPAAANKLDGNSVAVLPLLETGYFEGPIGPKTLKNLYVGYDLRDAASDNPSLTASYIDSPEQTSYTTITPSLQETLKYGRQALQLGVVVSGVAFKIAQTGASGDTRLYGLEADLLARERSR